MCVSLDELYEREKRQMVSEEKSPSGHRSSIAIRVRLLSYIYIYTHYKAPVVSDDMWSKVDRLNVREAPL